jgi:hypothetical protein
VTDVLFSVPCLWLLLRPPPLPFNSYRRITSTPLNTLHNPQECVTVQITDVHARAHAFACRRAQV